MCVVHGQFKWAQNVFLDHFLVMFEINVMGCAGDDLSV